MALSSYRLPWTGEGYDAWLQALKGQPGAYVIRDRRTRRVLYVGEAHNRGGGLYDAITRHFQAWRGRTAGVSFDRSAVEVAVSRTRKDEAIEEQNRLIRALDPYHNVQGRGPAREIEFKQGVRKTKRTDKPDRPRRSGWLDSFVPF